MRLINRFGVLTIACSLMPAVTAAQSATAPEPQAPAVSASVAAGPMQHGGKYSPIVIGSAQFSIGRSLRLEGEVTRSVATGVYTRIRAGESRSVRERRDLAAGINVFFQAGAGRIGGFAGGGLGIHRLRSRYREIGQFGFPTGREITVTDTQAGAQIVGGVDLRVGGPLGVFSTFRGELLPAPNLGMTAGVRLGLKPMARKLAAASHTAPLAAARDGQEIRVAMKTGERRTGRFVSLSATELVMKHGDRPGQVRLADVRRIEKVSHHARTGALIGLAGGVGLALAFCLADDNFCGDDASFGVLSAFQGGIGAGIGAGLGAMVNSMTADRHLVFESPITTTAQVAPILGNHKAGLALRLRW